MGDKAKDKDEAYQPKAEEDSEATASEKSNASDEDEQARERDAMAAKLLERLKQYFDENNVKMEEGWRIEIKQRTGGTSKGTSDAYYYSPANKRYRSRAEIARDFGFADDKPRAARGTGKGKAMPPRKLTKEEAVVKAKGRKEAFKTPFALANGVTVVSLGRFYDHEGYVDEEEIFPIEYMSRWTDDKGIIYTQTISIQASGPIFTIKARDKEDPEEVADAVVGTGHDPNEAWEIVGERQQEATEIALVQNKHRRIDADGNDLDIPGLEPGDNLLVKAAPVSDIWGMERYGFTDIAVLQAIEGLDKVEESEYEYVETRSNWEAEAKRLAKDAAKFGKVIKSSVKISAARPRPKTQAERDELTISKMLDRIIHQIEMGEVKAITNEQKAQMKKDRLMQKAMDKEDRLKQKQKEKEISRKLAEIQREKHRQATLAEQRLRAEAERTFDDETLATATIPLPLPPSLTVGKLPVEWEPVLVEVWQLMDRFPELLGLRRPLPRIDQLASSLISGPIVPQGDGAENYIDPVVSVFMALLDFLVNDLYTNTIVADDKVGDDKDLKDADLKPPNRAHPIMLTQATWQEVAHRLMALLATTAAEQSKTGMQGLAYPLAVMDPPIVLQYLTASLPPHFHQGPAYFPAKRSDTAAHGYLSCTDAAARVAAQEVVGSRKKVEDNATTTHLLRCLLNQLATLPDDKGVLIGSFLCSSGYDAAAAAKIGRPLDLRMVSARVDQGFYLAAEKPLEAFAEDIRHILGVWKLGSGKSKTLFAQNLETNGAVDVEVAALGFLEQALIEISTGSPEKYLKDHAPNPDAEPEPEAPAAEGEEPAAPKPAARQLSDEEAAFYRSLYDLGRPFTPWSSCAACWSSEDEKRIVECDRCSVQFHIYCLSDPLEDTPSEPWYCRRCAGDTGMDIDTPNNIEFGRSSGGKNFLQLSNLLASKEYVDMTLTERLQLLQVISMLVADSHALHVAINNEEDQLKETKKELNTLKQEIKKRQQEEQAAAQAAEEAAKAAAGEGGAPTEEAPVATKQQPLRSTRLREGDPAASALEMEETVRKMSKLEHDIKMFRPQRLTPIGTDRHYNRYWSLPAAAIYPHIPNSGELPPVVIVEREHNDSVRNSPKAQQPLTGEWQVGVYRNHSELESLNVWLNSKGTREKGLAAEIKKLRSQHLQLLDKIADSAVLLRQQQQQTGAPHVDANVSSEQLKTAMLEFEAAMTGTMRNDVWGSPDRMEAWKQSVTNARTPEQLMASVIQLESVINSDHLRPQWRLWSAPAPTPSSAKTVAAVWMRFEALRGAFKATVKVKLTNQIRQVLQVSKTRVSARKDEEANGQPAKPKGNKRWWYAQQTYSDGSEDTRGAKRSRRETPMSEGDDEIYAQRLNEALNGPGRATRSRLQTVGLKSDRGTSRRKYAEGSASEEEEWNDEDDEEISAEEDRAAKDDEYKASDAEDMDAGDE